VQYNSHINKIRRNIAVINSNLIILFKSCMQIKKCGLGYSVCSSYASSLEWLCESLQGYWRRPPEVAGWGGGQTGYGCYQSSWLWGVLVRSTRSRATEFAASKQHYPTVSPCFRLTYILPSCSRLCFPPLQKQLLVSIRKLNIVCQYISII